MSHSGARATNSQSAFTLIEVLLAVVLVGMLAAVSTMTFNAISRGWQVSTDYMDKLQRTDFALNQIVAGLRSMYYPHSSGKTDAAYGFVLTNNGDGEDVDDSDVIEWSKKGSAIVGKSSVADAVHRVRVMMCEEGKRFGKWEIEKTGLYARMCIDSALIPEDDEKDTDFTFENDELYRPVLVADGVVGFNCRVLPNADKVKAENDDKLFEDEFSNSNSVPYKVELTFRLADQDGRAYRNNTAPVMRIVTIPIHEQSLDGAMTPDASDSSAKKSGVGTRGGRAGGGGGGAGGGGAGGGGGGGGR